MEAVLHVGWRWCRTVTVHLLSTRWERLRGLLGTDATADPVMLVGCSSIHTFGMRYALDVAFLAADGTVVAVFDGVPPHRMLSVRGARHVIERPHESGPWLMEDDLVRMELVPTHTCW